VERAAVKERTDAAADAAATAAVVACWQACSDAGVLEMMRAWSCCSAAC
jgi:hypothetical protein